MANSLERSDPESETPTTLSERIGRWAAAPASTEDCLDELASRLPDLCETSQSVAGILWAPAGDGFRWVASEGVALEDASPESDFTGDIVANADAAFHQVRPDIFIAPDADDAPALGPDVPDPRIGELVLQHRQLIFPLVLNGQPIAVIALFQPNELPEEHLWSMEDVYGMQSQVQTWLAPTQPPIAEARSESKPTVKTEVIETDDSVPSDPLPLAASTIESKLTEPTEPEPVSSPAKPDPPQPITRSSDLLDSDSGLASMQRAASGIIPKDVDDAYFEVREQLELRQRAMRVNEVISRNLHETEVAYDVANEIHSFLGEGRIGVAIFRGRSARVRAISNQQIFDRRSAAVAALEKLATKSALIRRAIWHPEQADSLPPEIARLLDAYYEAADTQSIALLPLIQQREPSADPNDLAGVVMDRDSQPGDVVGVLTIEGLRRPIRRAEIEPQWEFVQQPVINAIANARRYNSLFLMPVWKELGHFTNLFRGHLRNKAIGVTAVIAALILALVAVPADFKLRCEGVVQPTHRSKIYAQAEGVVDQLLVDDGGWVEQGQILLTLSNPKLSAELAKVEGKLRETQQKLKTCRLQRLSGDFADDRERQDNVRQAAGFEASLSKIQQQYDLLLEKQAQLTVRSPAAGQVVTWDMPRRLGARPVQPGQKLLAIADPKGPWELELKLPDKRSGYLRDAWHRDNSADGNKPPRIKTTYVLASHPTLVREGFVREIARSADVDEQAGNIIRVYVDINPASEPESDIRTRPGTEVIAHIHTGRASIGYCKLYEFFDWARRLWFKYV